MKPYCEPRKRRALRLLSAAVVCLVACGTSKGEPDAACGSRGCRIAAPPVAPVAGFGRAIAIDGDRMIVGAPAGAPGEGIGAAHVYEWTDGAWTFQQMLQATMPTKRTADRFGASVAIRGERIVVGAPGAGWDDPNDTDDELNIERIGDVLVFERDSAGRWSQVQRIHALDRSRGDAFGASIAMDGEWLVVGSHLDDDGGDAAGSVYVYRHDGTRYVLFQKLHMTQNGPNDRFGHRVAIEGDILLASAHWDGYYAVGRQAGSVAIFRYVDGVWRQQQVLLGGTRAPFDQFGVSLDIDDEIIVVGAHQYDDAHADQGIVWVYRIVDSTDDHPWSVGEAVERILPPEPRAGAHFGAAVSIDDGRIVVGGNGTSVHVFREGVGQWLHEARLVSPDASPGASPMVDARTGFGAATRISGGRIIVGAPDEKANSDAARSVYQFDLEPAAGRDRSAR